jgi:hypothetical protein
LEGGRADAARVKTWHHDRPAQHERSELKKTVLGSTGTVRLGRVLKPLADLDVNYVWAVVEDKAGNLYVGTGEEGRIYKITPDGKSRILYTSEQGPVLSLAVGADGALYAGTGPVARVVRIDPGGNARVLCELRESYVWALCMDPSGKSLLAGTGPHGRIHRVGLDGKSSVFYETHQDHVLCLAQAGDGTLYAGTDKTGRVYRIDARGKGFVLYQAAQSEVRSLFLTPGGLYFGTSATRNRSIMARGSGVEGAAASLVTRPVPERVAVRLADKEKEEPATKEKTPGKGTPAQAPSEPTGGENSVYHVAADGAVRELFRDKLLMLSLVQHGSSLLAGTGSRGQLFEVDTKTREYSEIARLDHGQVLSLCRRSNGSVVGTGDPGRLYLLEEKFVREGTLTSPVLDAKLMSHWGTLTWRADLPARTGVGVAVRSGNVAEPDDTWSDWSAEQSDPETARVLAPRARFLQYRVTLRTEDPAVSPALRSLTIRYATTNQAPEVTKVEVPDLNAVVVDNPRKLKIKWTATDANEDELSYTVFVRKQGWSAWVKLEEELDKSEYEWDATTLPSGIYRVKVVASDHRDNPEKEALTGERISDAFVVCHTAPTVTLEKPTLEGQRARIQAAAVSPLVRLTAASYSIDGKKWVNVFPTDGLFDGRSKSFRFQTAELKAGTHVVVLRVQDAGGNTGSADLVFTVP